MTAIRKLVRFIAPVGLKGTAASLLFLAAPLQACGSETSEAPEETTSALSEANVNGVTEEEYREAAQSVDSDEDGVSNYDDNCPAQNNPDQEDADGDGIGDACDACPNRAAPGYTDGCPEKEAAEGGCEADIAMLDARLDGASGLTEAEKTAFRQARDMAADLCGQGNEAMAQQLLAGLLDRADDQAAINKTDKKKAAKAAESKAAPADYVLGEPRDDLDRFYGLYALPDSDNRKLFVAPADNGNSERPIPDGYLMVGAMWGDVAPWYMKSLADVRFEQQWVNPGGQPVRVEFQTGADGSAVSMSISSRYMNYDSMERVGDLPEKWQ